MLSILEALQFAFRKTHILIWGAFLYILWFTSFGIKIFNEDFQGLLEQMKSFSFAYSDIWKERPLGFVLMGIGLVALLYSYILMNAKKSVYGFNSSFSWRVLLKTFVLLFLGFSGYYYLREYGTHLLGSWAVVLENHHLYSRPLYFLSEIFFAFLFFMVFAPFVLAYMMQLNFTNYLVCLKNTYKNFIFVLRIFWAILLFALFLILPLEFAEYTISKMDIQSVLDYAHNSQAGSVLALFALMLMIGLPMGVLGCFTQKGRFFVVFTSAFFIWMYSIVSHYSQAEFSLTLTLYFYFIWLLVSLHMSILVIILPSGVLNLLAQGSFEIHSRFNKYVNHPGLYNGKRS